MVRGGGGESEGTRAEGGRPPIGLCVPGVWGPRGLLSTAIRRDFSERKRWQAQLADADRQRAVLARHFSPNMVEELMRSGGQLNDVRAQPITVLFADIFNFTAMSATTPITEVIGLLRRFHALVEEAVFA